MKLGVISDTHGNLFNLKKALDWMEENQVQVLIHCGDIGGSEMIKEMDNGFSGKIYLVFGNIEDPIKIKKAVDQTQGDLIFKEKVGEIELEGKNIAFCHKSLKAEKLAEKGKYDLVFYGHTHQPWEEQIGKCKLVNPGNLLGAPYNPTFAVYDTETDKLELKILEEL